jgi:outer membrane assembly lipoprotein YfiO
MGKAALVVGLICIMASITSAQTTRTWEYAGGGQWPQVASATTQSVGPNPALDRIEAMIKAGENKAAFKRAVAWLNSHKHDSQRDRGLMLAADALYQYGNRIKAFFYLDELMDECPDSKLYPQALEKQYAIANAYLNGYKRRLLYMPMFHAYDEAIEMLYRIQQRSPGSQLAEKALLRTANWYYADQQYDFAADTYAAFMRTYPRSPLIPRIKLRYAFSQYAQFRGPKFDATPVIDAREQLREVIGNYPQLAREEGIPDLVEQLDRNLARKLYWTADFYRRTNEPRGAVYTLRYLQKAYPQTPEAAKAKKELTTLPGWALAATPEPAVGAGFAPASPPIEAPRLKQPVDPQSNSPVRVNPFGNPSNSPQR